MCTAVALPNLLPFSLPSSNRSKAVASWSRVASQCWGALSLKSHHLHHESRLGCGSRERASESQQRGRLGTLFWDRGVGRVGGRYRIPPRALGALVPCRLRAVAQQGCRAAIRAPASKSASVRPRIRWMGLQVLVPPLPRSTMTTAVAAAMEGSTASGARMQRPDRTRSGFSTRPATCSHSARPA